MIKNMLTSCNPCRTVFCKKWVGIACNFSVMFKFHAFFYTRASETYSKYVFDSSMTFIWWREHACKILVKLWDFLLLEWQSISGEISILCSLILSWLFQVPIHIKTGPLICFKNQRTGFYMIGIPIMKELMEILNPPLRIIAFTLKFVQFGLVCSQTSYFYWITFACHLWAWNEFIAKRCIVYRRLQWNETKLDSQSSI